MSLDHSLNQKILELETFFLDKVNEGAHDCKGRRPMGHKGNFLLQESSKFCL